MKLTKEFLRNYPSFTRAKSVWFAMLLVLVLVACAAPVAPAAQPGGESAPAAASDDGPVEFVVAHPGSIGTMDAPKAWDFPTVWLHNMMHDCLIFRAGDGKGYVPRIAERWEAIDDLTWRFYIRPDLTFQNGEVLDAEAVKYNLDRVRTRDDFLVYPQWQFISEVIVVDPLTIEVKTGKIEAYFESNISGNGCQILPPQYLEEVGEEEYARNPIGAGPYRLAEFTANDRYVFERWEEYWGDKPEVDRVIYQVITEQGTQVSALLAGQVNFMSNVPFAELERVRSAGGIQIIPGSANTAANLVVRAYDDHGDMAQTYPGYVPSTTNKLIRQAISHAIDRTLLTEIQGSSVPALVRINAAFPEAFADRYVGPEVADAWYDPELAKQLILEAGYDPDAGNKPMVHFDAPALLHGNEKEVAEAVGLMLSDVGFEVEVNVMEYAALREQIEAPGNNRELYLRFNGGFVGLTPLFYNCEWLEPIYRICNEDWGALGAEIFATTDPTARLALWEQWWEFYLDESVTVTLYQINRNYGVSEGFNFVPRADGFLTFRDNLTIAE
jgi:peptide/nickel transport system substrate-binding protein